MLHYYFSDSAGRLQPCQKLENHGWINMVAPTQQEIETLSQELRIPLDFFTDSLDTFERSRVEAQDGCTLIIVDIPIVKKDDFKRDFFDTIPIGVIVTEHHLITICSHATPILEIFINNEVKDFSTAKTTRFVLQIFNQTADNYMKALRRLNRQTHEAEMSLSKAVDNELLYSMRNVEKSLIYFLPSLNSTKNVLIKMFSSEFLEADEEDRALLEEVRIEIDQAIEMADIHNRVLEGLMGTYTSIISNNVNDVMKALTLITIVLTAPTLVFSFYGMNVPLPFMNTNGAWIITLVISAILSLILAWILKRFKFF